MRADAAPSTQTLLGWQRRALVRHLAAKPRDFLAVATPGSGKTAFALRVASELLADGTVKKLTVANHPRRFSRSACRSPLCFFNCCKPRSTRSKRSSRLS